MQQSGDKYIKGRHVVTAMKKTDRRKTNDNQTTKIGQTGDKQTTNGRQSHPHENKRKIHYREPINI